MYQLSGLDNLMIGGETASLPMHMSAAMIYDSGHRKSGSISLETLQQTMSLLAHKRFPILRSRIEELPLRLDKAYWVEDQNFNMAAHVKRVALPSPFDWQQLYQLLGQFHTEPLSHNKPLWEMMLVEGLDQLTGIPKGSSALFVKIHHAVMDGTSAMRLLRGLHSSGPGQDAEFFTDNVVVKAAPPQDYRAPSWLMKYGKAWWNSIERPIDFAGTLVKLLPELWQTDSNSQPPDPLVTPRAHFNQPVSADRVVGHLRMNRATLGNIEQQLQCTINDIALCVVAGALRQFLLDRNELPASSLVAVMPINVRQRDKDGDIGNQVNLARIHLHTGTEDPLLRLRAIMTDTSRSKTNRRKSSAHAFIDILDEIHPALILGLGHWLMSAGYLDSATPLANTVISNVPGIATEAYVQGCRLIDYLGLGPLAPGVGLFHTVSSTPKYVNISFVSTHDLISDGATYRAALNKSYRKLLAIAKK